jgi:hypothetical protein
MDASVASQITVGMVQRFDQIVTAMEAAFAPFAGAVVTTPWTNVPRVGDIHGDGRVNVLIHNHTGGGFFSSGDYFIEGGAQPIALFHVGSSTISQGDVLYDVFAHEFQHLLFHLHFGVYMMTSGNPVTSQEFAWFNEALSELAGFLFANPGSETIDITRNWSAAVNSYSNPGDGRVGDFINFNNGFKSYGMSRFHGIFMHRNSPVPSYTRAVYDYFRTTFPISSGFASNRDRINQQFGNTNIMSTIMGNIYNAAGITSASGQLAFELVHFVFMEDFASDGGTIDIYQTLPFIDSTFSAHRLWGIRPSLGTNNLVFTGSSGGGFNLVNNGYPNPLPVLQSGGIVSMSGYDGTPLRGASHEMMYRLLGETAANPIVTININDDNPMTQWYAVVTKDPPGSSSSAQNRTFGSQGAAVYPLERGNVPNEIYTGGRATYLFVSTLYRNVPNVPVTYSWGSIPDINVTFSNAVSNGMYGIATTTHIHLLFDSDPGDISHYVTIPGGAVTSINVTGTGNTRVAAISGTWDNNTTADITINSPPGYVIAPSSLPVKLYADFEGDFDRDGKVTQNDFALLLSILYNPENNITDAGVIREILNAFWADYYLRRQD